MFYQFGAESAHRCIFLPRIAVRHDNRYRKAGALAGEGEALAVIAPRRRNEAFDVRLAAEEGGDIGKAAANLESARRLAVLVLDDGLGADPLAQQRPGNGRRRTERLEHELMRLRQLLETEHRERSRAPAR